MHAYIHTRIHTHRDAQTIGLILMSFRKEKPCKTKRRLHLVLQKGYFITLFKL